MRRTVVPIDMSAVERIDFVCAGRAAQRHQPHRRPAQVGADRRRLADHPGAAAADRHARRGISSRRTSDAGRALRRRAGRRRAGRPPAGARHPGRTVQCRLHADPRIPWNSSTAPRSSPSGATPRLPSAATGRSRSATSSSRRPRARCGASTTTACWPASPGATADAFTLFERFEAKLEKHQGHLTRAAVELAKDWRSDRILRRLEAMLAVADRSASLIITGNGDVLEPEFGIVAIGSGGPYAQAAARALLEHTDARPRATIVKQLARPSPATCASTPTRTTSSKCCSRCPVPRGARRHEQSG